MENYTDILVNCETNGLASPYHIDANTYRQEKTPFLAPYFPLATEPVAFTSHCEEIIVISDLHIASGKNNLGVYNGSENFFADQSFRRFMDAMLLRMEHKKALLVLNGDTFDFLRVTEFPGQEPRQTVAKKLKRVLYNEVAKPAAKPDAALTQMEFEAWSQELKKLGIAKSPEALTAAISKRERTYGLETDAYKTIYKLIRIRQGHPQFFTALAGWLSKGHRILVTKGNHDLELVWPEVRHYIRLLVAEAGMQGSVEQNLRAQVLPNLFFADDAVLVDNCVYLEHGHRYDKFCMVLQSPHLKNNPSQLNIPFGSFFNRYLINRVELYYPYLDKVRPAGNIVPILVRENFPLAIKVFCLQLPFAVRMLFTNGRYIWFMLRRVLPLLLVVVPVAVYGYMAYNSFGSIAGTSGLSRIAAALLKLLGSTGSLVLAYFIARIVAWLQLVEPTALDAYAYRLYRKTNARYPVMTMGHTHNPGSYANDSGLFYNTGTWIPVIETSTAEVRVDRTYTFLHLLRDAQGGFAPVKEQLQRWNDDAGRPEPQLLIRRKG